MALFSIFCSTNYLLQKFTRTFPFQLLFSVATDSSEQSEVGNLEVMPEVQCYQ